MSNFDPYEPAKFIDGRGIDLSDGRTVKLYRFDVGVELQLSRPALEQDAVVPEYDPAQTAPHGQAEFRKDGKLITRVMLSHEAATAVFMLIGWVTNADILAGDVILRERERCAKVAEAVGSASESWQDHGEAARDIALRIRSGE